MKYRIMRFFPNSEKVDEMPHNALFANSAEVDEKPHNAIFANSEEGR